jgi:hypothetical protein
VRRIGVLTMSVAYLIRRKGEVCSVIELWSDNREKVVQDGLSPIEAEILCVAKIEDLPRQTAEQPVTSAKPESTERQPRTARQLELKI